jgi:hypothetical protein
MIVRVFVVKLDQRRIRLARIKLLHKTIRDMYKYYVIAIVLFLSSCYREKKGNPKELDELLKDTTNITIQKRDGNIFRIYDKDMHGLSGGVYSFDGLGTLRDYTFLDDDRKYSYSEEYDSSGGLLKREGVPLVECRVWNKNKDTTLFMCFFFSMNKKYEDLQITTNKKDTISPILLYKNTLYTNMKSTSFNLPYDVNNINKLVIYIKGRVKDTCSNSIQEFIDTLPFNNVKFGNISK